MQLLITVNKLNKRSSIPASFAEKNNIVGTVLKGYKFEGQEDATAIDPSMGKWYKDTDGYFYWGGGLIVVDNTPAMDNRRVTIGGLPTNLPEGFLLGADLSHHNDKPDWDAINAAGISLVYLKVSEGVGTPDNKAKEHAANAKRYGIKIGYYHFCRPDTRNGNSIESDALAEANDALNLIKNLPTPDLPLVLDLENEQGWDSKLEPGNYGLWVDTFISEIVRQTGTEPIMYSYKSYMDGKFSANHHFGKYRLWLANYSVTDCRKLALPKGWSDWASWQFTEKTKIGGNEHP